MKRGWALHVVGVLSIVGGFGCGRAPLAKLTPGRENVRQIPTAEYVDRMKAGWIGQMAGVGWGGPTEFRYKGAIIPEDQMPEWKPAMINQFEQDDIYVEMTSANAGGARIRRVHSAGGHRFRQQRLSALAREQGWA